MGGGGGRFALGDSIAYSYDGKTWSRHRLHSSSAYIQIGQFMGSHGMDGCGWRQGGVESSIPL